MDKAVIGKDGWIRCSQHGKKLGRIDADGIKLWCTHDRGEVLIDCDALETITKGQNK